MLDNKKNLESEKEIKIFDKINKYHGCILAIVAAFFAFGTIILKAYDYLRVNAFFNYYGIDYELYQENILNLFYTAINFFIFTTLTGYALYFIYETYKQKDIKEKIKNGIYTTLINLFLIYYLIGNSNLIIANLIIITITEIICIYFMKKPIKKEQNINLKDYLKRIIKIMPIYLLFLILLTQCNEIIQNLATKEYKIINNNQVIIYTAKDYYLTLNCSIDINTNKITIFKGTQTKIANNQISTKTYKFDQVIVE